MALKFKIGDKVRVRDVEVGTEVHGMPGDVIQFMGPMRLTVGCVGYVCQASGGGFAAGAYRVRELNGVCRWYWYAAEWLELVE